MFGEMKIGNKIWLGFGGVLGITGVLGAVAVISMSNVRTASNKLADEYVPEVLVANNVERSALTVMYNVRGYSLTGDIKYLDKGKAALDAVDKALKEAVELAEKSPNLIKLKENAPAAALATKEYRTLLEETIKNTEEGNKVEITMNASAKAFMDNAYAYLDSQNKKLTEQINKGDKAVALKDRVEKINSINDVVDLGNAVRLARLNGLAFRDSSLAEKAMPNFEKMIQTLTHMKSISVDPKNITELENTLKAGLTYKENMLKEIELTKQSAELSAKREVASEKVTKLAETTSITGATETKHIADSAATSLGAAVVILLIGLSIAMAIGISLSVIIVRSISTALTEIGKRLADASQQVLGAANQMSSAAQQLASGAAEQASAIEETTASLEEMGGMVANNVDNAKRAADLSQRVATVADTGNQSMVNMQGSMKDILASNDKIEELVRVIAAIGEKTKVMDEIVFQTKLLSFNASVEAERAGEHGRGFAVVAQEVGNLAQMSGKSAQEIADILSISIKNAEVITTENRKKVEVGASLVTETSGSLKEILESARTVTTGANQVLEASKEQSSGIKQINSAMSNLEKATQENASMAEEVASTSEELSAQTDLLNSAVLELDRMINGVTSNNSGQGRVAARQVPRAAPSNAHGAGNVHDISHSIAKKNQKKDMGGNITKKAVGSSFEPQSSSHSDDAWEKL